MSRPIGYFEREARLRRAWRGLYYANRHLWIVKRDWESIEDDRRFDGAMSRAEEHTTELARLVTKKRTR